jgi:protein-disulfide isomerase
MGFWGFGVLGVLLIGFVAFSLSNGNVTGNVVSTSSIGQNVIDSLNKQTGGGVTLASGTAVTKESGVYKIMVSYQGQTVPIYSTLDGKLVGSLSPVDGSAVNPDTAPTTGGKVTIDSAQLANAPMEGSKDAKVTIVEFSDFQCPFCEAFFTRTMPAFLTDFIQKGSMFFTYRDLPLDGHYNAFPASEAVHCAGDQNRFYAMHDMLFSFSDLWTDARDAQPVFEKFADALGLDTDKFRACMNQHAFSGAIHASLSEANALGITGTPGFSVNGFKVSGAQSVDYFKKVFEIVQNPKLLKDYQDAEKKAEDAAKKQNAKVQK